MKNTLQLTAQLRTALGGYQSCLARVVIVRVSENARRYTFWAYTLNDVQVPITYHAIPAGQPSPLDR